MRLFFAVAVPDEILERVGAVQTELRERIGDEGVRWTRSGQFHYTLKFLGEQSFQRAETAVEVATAIAEEGAPFEIALSGVGAFPNDQRPSILWLGAAQGADELVTLATRLDDVLSRRGFPHEKKPLKAHLTLARIKTYAGEAAVARTLRSAPEANCGSFRVDQFVLMRSILKPSGSEYSILKGFNLKATI